jgi:hypothetical protein
MIADTGHSQTVEASSPAVLVRWRRLLIATGILLIVLQLFRVFYGAQTHLVTSDGDWYYAYLVSAYLDRDLDLSDEMAAWQRIAGRPELSLPVGIPTPNPFTIGPALMWLPAFAAADLGVVLARALGSDIPRDGYAMPYQIGAAFATLLYGLLGVWFAFRASLWWCGRGEQCWREGPGLATGGALLASPALYYLFFEPTMSHGLSIFAASLLAWLWLRTDASSGWGRWAALGLAGGLCALIRPQDCLLLLLPLAGLALVRPPRPAARAAALVGAAAVAFLPQMVVWWLTFGRPLGVPQGPGFMCWSHPALLQVWFSPHHGLFTWTPIWFISFLGLAGGGKERKPMLAMLLVVFLLESYANAAAADWWAGDSFGARRFLSMFPLFTIGLSGLACRVGSRSPGTFVAVLAVATAANLAVMAAYVTGRIPHG